MNYQTILRNLEAKLGRQKASVDETEAHLQAIRKLALEEANKDQPPLPMTPEKKK